MGDLKDHRLIYLKGSLFLAGILLSTGILLLENTSWKTAGLLALTIWCSARFYYFLFYVIQHYVDQEYRFSGIGSFLAYLWRKRRSSK